MYRRIDHTSSDIVLITHLGTAAMCSTVLVMMKSKRNTGLTLSRASRNKTSTIIRVVGSGDEKGIFNCIYDSS